MSKHALAKLLSDDSSYLTTVFYASIAALDYDLEAMQVDPEGLILDVEQAVGVRLSEDNRAKLLAAQVLLFSDVIYNDLPAFVNFCNLAASRDAPSTHVFDPADLYEIAWALVEIMLLDTLSEETLVEPNDRSSFMRASRRERATVMQFSEEIRRYWGEMTKLEGATRPILAVPQAIMLDDGMANDAELQQASLGRADGVERSVSQFVLDNATVLMSQLRQILTADGEPLVDAKLSEQILAKIGQGE